MTMNVSGEVVKQLRLKHGWTQEHLAHLANMNVRTVQRVERNGICDLETRSALAAVFRIDVAQLDGGRKIEQSLSGTPKRPLIYQRIESGQQLVDVFAGAQAYRITNEEPRSGEDTQYIAWVVDHIKDTSEIWDEMELGARVEATFEFTGLLKELDEKGLRLLGLKTKAKMTAPPSIPGTPEPAVIKVANLHVAYADSHKVFVLDPTAT